jgi:uncharacterized membrane protein YhhN
LPLPVRVQQPRLELADLLYVQARLSQQKGGTMISSDKRALTVIAIVIVLTLLAQVPAMQQWIQNATINSPHLFTLAEGIFGLFLLIFATSNPPYGGKP